MQAASKGVLMIIILQSLVTVSELAKAWNMKLNADRVDSQAEWES